MSLKNRRRLRRKWQRAVVQSYDDNAKKANSKRYHQLMRKAAIERVTGRGVCPNRNTIAGRYRSELREQSYQAALNQISANYERIKNETE